MIEKFNNVEMRDTAIIYSSNLEQIKEYYSIDPNSAGELAISIIEVALTGQMSTTNPIVKMALANYKDVAGKNGVKYDKRVEAKKEARIEKLQLRPIAKMYLEGMSQKAIAKALGKGESTISDNLKIIRSDFPELLQRNPENSTDLDELGELLLENNPENSAELGEFSNELPNCVINSENSVKSGKLGEFENIQRNPENSENSEHVNDNVNVNENVNENVNVTRVSSNEETLETISLEELNRMGAKFELDGDIATFTTGKRMRVETKKREDGTWDF